MKSLCYVALLCAASLLQACGSENQETAVEQTETSSAEATVNQEQLQEVETELDSAATALKQSAKTTETAVDSLLNDL